MVMEQPVHGQHICLSISICLCGRRRGLRGEALAHRIGFERPRAPMAERLATVQGLGYRAADMLAVTRQQRHPMPGAAVADHVTQQGTTQQQ